MLLFLALSAIHSHLHSEIASDLPAKIEARLDFMKTHITVKWGAYTWVIRVYKTIPPLERKQRRKIQFTIIIRAYITECCHCYNYLAPTYSILTKLLKHPYFTYKRTKAQGVTSPVIRQQALTRIMWFQSLLSKSQKTVPGPVLGFLLLFLFKRFCATSLRSVSSSPRLVI